MKRPWMPLYIADYLRDTTHVGALLSGAYLHLIMHYWTHGGLPSDERELALIAKLTVREWKRSRVTLKAFFHDGWKHKRIDQELAHSLDVSNKRSAVAAERQAKLRELAACKDSAIAPANGPTLHTTQRKKEEDTASAVSPYVFESGVIRLKQSDFDKWTKAYRHLNLPAELLSLTEWAGQQPKWFFAVSSALAKRDREVMAKKESAKTFKWASGIEGVY